MGVPEEIRAVERPPNTVVIQYGKNKDRYAVKQRIGCRSVNGRKIPIEGPIIGHIIDGAYVPKPTTPNISMSNCDYKRWADVKFCVDSNKDILDDLLSVYSRKDAFRVFTIAVLRAIDPDINDYELSSEYKETWLSEMYPDVALSKNTVGDFLYNLGLTCSRITEFMRIRTDRVSADHHVAVDGTLKSDESKVNTFSDYSRKALKKGTRDISVIFAYDVTTGEPVCSKAYPGNQVDVSVLEDFIRTNKVDRGIIVADKGFSYNAAKKAFSERPELHFLIPLRRNADVIGRFRMYDYNSTLKEYPGVTCRKERMFDGKFLYSYRDAQRASEEEIAWTKANNDCDPRELNELRKEFGSIVFISDVDMDMLTAYRAYGERWKLEVMFMFYKDILRFDQTRVHEDCSVMGTEFINFLSILMVCRMRKVFENVEQLKGVPFNTVIKKLKRVSKIRDPNGQWAVREITDKEQALMTELGIFPKIIDVKNPRGRPRKEKVEKPKRPRGRPRKNLLPEQSV